MKVAVIDAYGAGTVYEIDGEFETSAEVKKKGRKVCDFDTNVSEEA